MILTNEIERLKAFRKENRGSPAVGEQLLGAAGYKQAMLEGLLTKHPALDYADKLYAFVKKVADGAYYSDGLEAQALIDKMEGKK